MEFVNVFSNTIEIRKENDGIIERLRNIDVTKSSSVFIHSNTPKVKRMGKSKQHIQNEHIRNAYINKLGESRIKIRNEEI